MEKLGLKFLRNGKENKLYMSSSPMSMRDREYDSEFRKGFLLRGELQR